MSTDNIKFCRNQRILNWILLGLAVVSSLCRADWNIVFGCIGLAIINKFFSKDPAYFTGILFALFSVSIIMDSIWMIIVLPNWSSDESTAPTWKSLGFIHGLVGFFAFLEVVVKGVMVFLFHRKGALENFKFINDSGIVFVK